MIEYLTFSDDAVVQTEQKLLNQLELLRVRATTNLKPELGQFLTPLPVASFMAKLFPNNVGTIRLLDPGAGTGMLSAACIIEFCSRSNPPSEINLTAYEVDKELFQILEQTIQLCQYWCEHNKILLKVKLIQSDFIEETIEDLTGNLFRPAFAQPPTYTHIILNPPYQKIQTLSKTKKLLRQVGIEASNLYTGFVALSVLLLEKEGELVALTPRSFCNGLYFKSFRKFLLHSQQIAFNRIHLFESREKLFQEANVLQENIIFHLKKSVIFPHSVQISIGDNITNPNLATYSVGYNQIIHADDSDYFVRIPDVTANQPITQKIKTLKTSLTELNLQVSTGRVVEFRAKEFLGYSVLPEGENVPLLHPKNLGKGYANWPDSSKNRSRKRPVTIQLTPETRSLLVPNELYVLVKRFTSKEEPRRLVAAIYDPSKLPWRGEVVGFENHLNYFHQNGRGFSYNLALGLTVFLNSTWLDNYFRGFNGHTQVNATDLRNLRYPSQTQLERLGHKIATSSSGEFPSQPEIDKLVADLLESYIFHE